MILDRILTQKRKEVEDRSARRPLTQLEQEAAVAPPPRGFAAALREPGLSIIAEIKRKSPSGGDLRPDASAAELADTYARSGAAALSVLTDFTFFGGSDQDLLHARYESGLPTMRKDFVIDEYQIYEARVLGADAVLLIVRSLDPASLSRLLQLAHDLQLDALVEAHSEQELNAGLNAGATLLGVNNRDLDTLVTDPSLALRLRELSPPEVTFVAESGVSTAEQMRALAAARVDAALIGEALVRAPDPGARLQELLAAAAPAKAAAQ